MLSGCGGEGQGVEEKQEEDLEVHFLEGFCIVVKEMDSFFGGRI